MKTRARRIALASAAVLVMLLVAACGPKPVHERETGCAEGMARIDDGSHAFCIDRFEAALVEIAPDGSERPFSPYDQVKSHHVKAVARGGLVPQAYISRNEAGAACREAKKRLCTEAEWVRACQGKTATTFPYGNERKTGLCNDNGKPALARYYATMKPAANEWDAMNDPRLDQMSDTVAKSGAHPQCKSSEGVYDLMGNLHEWVSDPGGTFLGGYFLDTKLNGDGCHYKTSRHDAAYHDYSTGFRCCADVQ